MLPRGLRRGQVDFRSHNSCVSLGVSLPGQRRACVLFEIFFFWNGYSATELPGGTVWLTLHLTGRGGLSVLSQKRPAEVSRVDTHLTTLCLYDSSASTTQA